MNIKGKRQYSHCFLQIQKQILSGTTVSLFDALHFAIISTILCHWLSIACPVYCIGVVRGATGIISWTKFLAFSRYTYQAIFNQNNKNGS